MAINDHCHLLAISDPLRAREEGREGAAERELVGAAARSARGTSYAVRKEQMPDERECETEISSWLRTCSQKVYESWPCQRGQASSTVLNVRRLQLGFAPPGPAVPLVGTQAQGGSRSQSFSVPRGTWTAAAKFLQRKGVPDSTLLQEGK